MKTYSVTRRICSLALVALGLVGLVVYTYGALLLGGQAYYWLRTEVWVPLPTTALVLEAPLAKDTANSVASGLVLAGTAMGTWLELASTKTTSEGLLRTRSAG